ncbi:hypothetical protein PTTG_27970 [Puccinia triticina 1-1 BBBD Race 1]|uniref:Uncharacterized protein n=2 Tax=Puccinia triticina TaxID=208348 RepID=A0A180GF77_PUCT1|nr:uncharacterized protein PtA15_3A378 [Puccinia triticina]OAV91376.1 hypothetical protein PTTG_27970 [Puccinia triticina 1-1 BBBD Race 1]WAQ83012.1 hypothetical protein PtA15_3A378 [Puccinia triticina]WAR53841.1 hypothetical protein PtB15_3B350 [Puccinia triticina]
MKACQGFIHLLSVFVLVTGVCFAVRPTEFSQLYTHEWSGTVTNYAQTKFIEQHRVSVHVQVQSVQPGKPPFDIKVNNPLPRDVHVTINQEGKDIPVKDERLKDSNFVKTGTFTPVKVAQVDTYPERLTVHFSLPKADYQEIAAMPPQEFMYPSEHATL